MGYIDRGDDGPPSHDQFADHFEWDGPRWLYYRDGWKAPVPVSHEEHDRAISWHENGTLGMVGLGIAVSLALMFTPFPLTDGWPEPVKATIVIVALVMILSAAGRGSSAGLCGPICEPISGRGSPKISAAIANSNVHSPS